MLTDDSRSTGVYRFQICARTLPEFLGRAHRISELTNRMIHVAGLLHLGVHPTLGPRLHLAHPWYQCMQ